jgi:hypothetical protein
MVIPAIRIGRFSRKAIFAADIADLLSPSHRCSIVLYHNDRRPANMYVLVYIVAQIPREHNTSAMMGEV